MAYARIQVRFDQPGYAIYCNLESLLLKAANQENYSVELQKVISIMEMTSMRVNFPHSCKSLAQILPGKPSLARSLCKKPSLFCGLCLKANGLSSGRCASLQV